MSDLSPGATVRIDRGAGLPLALAVLVADAVTVIGLLLPWAHDHFYARNAFTLPVGVPLVMVLAMIIRYVVLAAPLTLPRGRSYATERAAVTVAVTLTAAVVSGSLASRSSGHGVHLTWPGPVVAIAASVFAGIFASRAVVTGDGGPPRLRTHVGLPLGAAGFVGLFLAGIGLLSVWQRLTGPVVSVLTGGRSYVWTGSELGLTVGLRWLVGAAAGLALACAAVPALRRAVCVVQVVAGLAIVIIAVDRQSRIPVRGLTSALESGPGVWLTVAGGGVSALAGAAALVMSALRHHREPPGRRAVLLPTVTAAAVVTLLVASVLTAGRGAQPAGAATADRGVQILADDVDQGPARLGGSSTDIVPAYSNGRPDVVDTADGRVWFLTVRDATHMLLDEVVHGHALPVTVLEFDESEVDLVAVADGYAVIASGTALYRVDLRSPAHDFTTYDHRPPTPVLQLITDSDYRAGAGAPGTTIGTTLTAKATGLGSVEVTVGTARGAVTYLVPPSVANGASPWVLRTRVATDHSTEDPSLYSHPVEYDTAGRQYLDVSEHLSPALVRQSAAGLDVSHLDLVFGGVSDPRCTLSRDPGSVYAQTEPPFAVDRTGEVWVVQSGVQSTRDLGGQLTVRLTSGELRRVALPTGVLAQDVFTMADGALLVQTVQTATHATAYYRFASAAAAARSSTTLPVVPTGCVSENRPAPRTLGNRVVELPGTLSLSPDVTGLAVIDGSGTALISYGPRLIRMRPGGRVTTVESDPGGDVVRGLSADGRGGAWWIVQPYSLNGSSTSRRASIHHLDPTGTITVVRADLASPDPESLSDGSADPYDGSFWFRFPGVGTTWQRVTVDGHTTSTRYTGDGPIFGGGQGFGSDQRTLTHAPSNVEEFRISAAGAGARVLGAAKGSPVTTVVAAQEHRPATDTIDDGILAVTSDGRLLVLQDGYLARLDRSGVTLVAGPQDGLPAFRTDPALDVIGSDLFLIDTTGHVYRVQVS